MAPIFAATDMIGAAPETVIDSGRCVIRLRSGFSARRCVSLEDRIGAMKISQSCDCLPLAQLIELRVVLCHRSRFIAKDVGNLANGNIPNPA
jgi:hypothetical protein